MQHPLHSSKLASSFALYLLLIVFPLSTGDVIPVRTTQQVCMHPHPSCIHHPVGANAFRPRTLPFESAALLGVCRPSIQGRAAAATWRSQTARLQVLHSRTASAGPTLIHSDPTHLHYYLSQPTVAAPPTRMGCTITLLACTRLLTPSQCHSHNSQQRSQQQPSFNLCLRQYSQCTSIRWHTHKRQTPQSHPLHKR